MSTVVENEAVRAEGMEVLSLLPEEIAIHDAIHALRSNRDSKKYQDGIEELARTIEEDGQLQNGLVMEVEVEGGVEYQLIDGSRRRDAISLINAGKGKNDQPRRMNLTVVRGEEALTAVRKAIRANTQRENFSPMSLARNIETVRKLLKVEKAKDWSKSVAEYMGVSRATVTQHYKLFDLPKDIQDRIDNEGWSSDAAQALLDVKPEKRAEVAAGAKKKAEEDKQKKAATPPVSSKGEKAEKGTDKPSKASGKGEGKAEGKGEAKPTGPNKKHVVAAAREQDALEKKKPLAKSEIIDFFDSIDGPAYGHEDSPVRAFARYFVDKFAMGIGNERTAMKKFDAMVLNAKNEPYSGVGTKKEEPKPKTAAAGGKK